MYVQVMRSPNGQHPQWLTEKITSHGQGKIDLNTINSKVPKPLPTPPPNPIPKEMELFNSAQIETESLCQPTSIDYSPTSYAPGWKYTWTQPTQFRKALFKTGRKCCLFNFRGELALIASSP